MLPAVSRMEEDQKLAVDHVLLEWEIGFSPIEKKQLWTT